MAWLTSAAIAFDGIMMHPHAEWLLLRCKEAATSDFGRLRMCTALSTLAVDACFMLCRRDGWTARIRRVHANCVPPIVFSILQLQRNSTLSSKEARSSRNRVHEQYGLLSSLVLLNSLLNKPSKPTSEPQTLAGSFLLLPFTIALLLDFVCIATTMTQYVAGSTGQRPNAGGKLTGVRSVAAVSGQPYAVPAEARAPLIGQGETNRAERTGPN